MSWGFSQTSKASTERAGPAAPRVERHRSLALAALVQDLPRDGSARILDLGPAAGVNIEFLSRFGSRIRVEDLYPSLRAAGLAPEGEVRARVAADEQVRRVDAAEFAPVLQFGPETAFDLVLLWELLDYLDPECIRALVAYLAPFCAPGAFVLALTSTTKQVPAVPIRFRFADEETLLYHIDSDQVREAPRYTPRDVAHMMAGFRVQQSFLLKTGIQEYLFVRSGD